MKERSMRGRVAALVPAYNESDRVTRAVSALLSVPEVNLILVIDDGSRDDTAGVVAAMDNPNVRLSRLRRNRGKGAALNHGMKVLAREDFDIYVFCDADLGGSAREVRRLILPVLAGRADMVTAVFSDSAGGGGLGLVVGLARLGVRILGGEYTREPLSGQRAFTDAVWKGSGPCAGGFAVEVVLTVRALRGGFRLLEVPTAMSHRVTGNSAAGILHRARQLLDVAAGLLRVLLQIRRESPRRYFRESGG